MRQTGGINARCSTLQRSIYICRINWLSHWTKHIQLQTPCIFRSNHYDTRRETIFGCVGTYACMHKHRSETQWERNWSMEMSCEWAKHHWRWWCRRTRATRIKGWPLIELLDVIMPERVRRCIYLYIYRERKRDFGDGSEMPTKMRWKRVNISRHYEVHWVLRMQTATLFACHYDKVAAFKWIFFHSSHLYCLRSAYSLKLGDVCTSIHLWI